jgi:ABC-type multidrug transport system fused ATPase/permease subunit
LKLRDLVDTNLSVFYSVKAMDRWLSVRLETLGNVVVLAAAFASVFLTRAGKMKAGAAGWGLTQSLAITGLLTWAVRVVTDLETQMMSVMRVNELTNTHQYNDTEKSLMVPQEKAEPGEALDALYYSKLFIPSSPMSEKGLASTGWPWSGEISMKNVSVRYSPSSQRALKNINIHIPSGTTLGVVGRTGSGKSSLLLTLFRLMEIDSGGSIEIDGVDIRSISLDTLRGAIAIIPQDPVLFQGTLFFNLDATGKASESEAWDALRAASPDLADQFQKSQDGLYSTIKEGGKNLSAGQRQLICLARALLRKSKILVLDEATSSVDPKTDALVQETIRRQFVEKGVSVITVAHRLDTVLGSDKIAVLGEGKLLEFGSPNELLRKHNGHFYKLVDAYNKNKRKGGKATTTVSN